MNPALASEIVNCLPVSGSPRADISLPFSAHPWEHTLEWLDHSGIALLWWNRVKESGEEKRIPAEIGERVEKNLTDHRIRVAAMAEEFDSINQVLGKAGVRYAAMKGLTLIPDYCSDIFLRTTYDYDYLLPQESMTDAEEALRAAGYIRKEDPEDHPVVYFHKTRIPRSPLNRDDLYSAGFPRTVELHYLFWDPTQVGISLELPRDIVARRVLRRLDIPANPPGRPIEFYGLAEEDDLTLQLLHAFKHILHNWCRLCSLLDIAYFLQHRASDAAFWDRFLVRIDQSTPLCEIAGVVFLLAAGVFGGSIPEPVAARIIQSLRSPLVLWVNRYGLESALDNFSSNKFNLFLHREFIRDDAAWNKIRRNHLFPIHRPNKAVHGAGMTLASRQLAKWKQAVYVAGRLKHHLAAGAQYSVESLFWGEARSKSCRPEDR